MKPKFTDLGPDSDYTFSAMVGNLSKLTLLRGAAVIDLALWVESESGRLLRKLAQATYVRNPQTTQVMRQGARANCKTVWDKLFINRPSWVNRSRRNDMQVKSFVRLFGVYRCRCVHDKFMARHMLTLDILYEKVNTRKERI